MEDKAPRLMIATGLGSAMGRALVDLLGDTWRIISISRQAMQDTDRRIDWIGLDLRAPAAQLTAVLEDRLAERWVASVDAVVHMAGLVYSDRWESSTPAEWADMTAVNLTAAMALLKVVSPRLGPGGSVVLVGSVDAAMASIDGPAAAYAASKAGLVGLCRQLAVEWGERGIRVNVVEPGALSSGAGPKTSGAASKISRRTALGRLGEPREVAAAIRFLLSPEASYITGAVLPVNGGLGIGY
jgi:3-oxoacyl-[acyl-carrier protein] reductase